MRSVPLFKSLRSLWWIALIGAVGFTAMWAAFFTYSTWFAPTHPLPELSLESVEPEVANLVQAEMRRLQEQPRSSEAWGRFGKILLANGLAEPAMYCFEQAARLDRHEPRWPYYQVEYNAIRDVSRAEALLRSAVALNQKASPENHAPRLRLVELLLSQGRLDEAENELAPMVGLDSRDPRIRYNRGMLAFHREQWEKARDALTPLASDPVASRLVMAPLSMIYKRLGQAEKADEYTRRASELAGKDDSWDDPYLSEYKNLNVRKDLRLRMAYYAEEMSRLQEGLEVLKKVVREGGENDPISHLALGNNLMKQGQFKAAADVYRRTLQLAPSSSRTLDMLSLALSAEGERLRQQGDSKPAKLFFQEAFETAKRAADLQPQDAIAMLQVGRTLLALDRPEEAVEPLRMAVVRRPENPRLHCYLADALDRIGKTEEARQSLQRGLKIAPPADPVPREIRDRLEAKWKKKQ